MADILGGAHTKDLSFLVLIKSITEVQELSQDREYYNESKLCQGTPVDSDVSHRGWCLPFKVHELEVSWGKTQASFTTVLT